MDKQIYYPKVREILADTVTPVSVYLRLRTLYPKSLLLESSDYHGNENAWSFICLEPISGFTVEKGKVTIEKNGKCKITTELSAEQPLHQLLADYFDSFVIRGESSDLPANGLFGYMGYDAVPWFEKIRFEAPETEESHIPEVKYSFYKYIIAIDHHKNSIRMVENLVEGEASQLDHIHHLLINLNFNTTGFKISGEETSTITDEDYLQMVTKGKEHCQRGDIFQVVLSRQFAISFEGDDFNVYRSLRSVNPSPYLFYFDFGSYRIFGSSPEAQIRVNGNKATIYPIAGTFPRTGNDEQDKELARKLCLDPKENAEHVMLVDLARNDLSRHATGVVVETFREVQFYSHVIHLVSKVTGELSEDVNLIRVLGDSFPAGTLSGAPKYRAMQLIDKYEKQRRGFYGGCIGFLGFDRTVNHAIIIRSFLSKNKKLFYQAGAGIVAGSSEKNELQEVGNKLAALKRAIEVAGKII